MSMSPFPTRVSWQYLIVEFERVFGEAIEFVKGCRTTFLFFLDNKYPPSRFPSDSPKPPPHLTNIS